MLAEWWTSFGGRCAVSTAASAVALLLWWCWPAHWTPGRQRILLLICAGFARLLFFDLPASDDVHRYVWEGQIVLGGQSPYTAPANAPMRADSHDEHWQRMNHKDKLTAYPPLALMLCALVEAAQGIGQPTPLAHVAGFKVSAIIADLLLVLLLSNALKELRWAAIYALNPVPLISYAGEGHFDAWMVVAMVASIVWIKHPRWAWTCLALGIGIKFMAALLLPVLWFHTPKEQRGRAIRCGLIALLLPALPFVQTWPNLARGLFEFGAGTSSNATVHWLLELLLGSKLVASLLCGLGLIITAYTARVWQRAPAEAARAVFTLLLILAPTVTYWYPGWALPFAALAPHPALWVLSTTDILYYAAWDEAQRTSVWWLPRWAWALLWGPFYAALLWRWTARR
jgi:hypothetical protein